MGSDHRQVLGTNSSRPAGRSRLGFCGSVAQQASCCRVLLWSPQPSGEPPLLLLDAPVSRQTWSWAGPNCKGPEGIEMFAFHQVWIAVWTGSGQRMGELRGRRSLSQPTWTAGEEYPGLRRGASGGQSCSPWLICLYLIASHPGLRGVCRRPVGLPRVTLRRANGGMRLSKALCWQQRSWPCADYICKSAGPISRHPIGSFFVLLSVKGPITSDFPEQRAPGLRSRPLC